MKYQLIQCDLCGVHQERKEYGWWENFNGAFRCLGKDGLNHTIEFEHLCYDCRAELNNAVIQVIKDRTQRKEA